MIRKRLGLKALGLCVLAIGVMSFAVAAAQAAAPEWMANGEAGGLKAGLEPALGVEKLESAANKEVKSAELLVQVGTIHVLILCTAAQFESVKLTSGGKTTEGQVLFSGCSTMLNGSPSPPCVPISSAGEGKIITKKGHGEIVLVETAKVTKIVPTQTKKEEEEKKPPLFAQFELGSGECSVGENVEVTGSLTAKDANSKAEIEEKTHLIEEGPGTSLKALNNPAKLVGGAVVRLEGAHSGVTFSGLWP